MTNLPKELEEIMVNDAQTFFGDDGAFYQSGFNACYQSMLNTYVPKEKVDKLVEALIEMKNMLWTKQAEIHRVLKEYEGENV